MKDKREAMPPLLPATASPARAKVWVRQLIRFIGPLGFHPDTRFRDYVRPDGTRSFTPAQCRILTTGLKRATDILNRAGVDIYRIGLREQRRLLTRKG